LPDHPLNGIDWRLVSCPGVMCEVEKK